MIPVYNGAFTLVQGRQPDLPIMAESQLTWAPYFSTVVKAPAAENIIASVFCPSDLRKGEGSITCQLDSSGATPALSYTLRGKTTKFVLAADKITRADH